MAYHQREFHHTESIHRPLTPSCIVINYIMSQSGSHCGAPARNKKDCKSWNSYSPHSSSLCISSSLANVTETVIGLYFVANVGFAFDFFIIGSTKPCKNCGKTKPQRDSIPATLLKTNNCGNIKPQRKHSCYIAPNKELW